MKNANKPSQAIPFWRDIRVLGVLAQVAFLVAVAGALWWLYNNLQRNLAATGLNISFNFLRDTAGFPISETSGLAYHPTNDNGYAFWIGVVNTLRVALVGVVLATVVGTVVGISRLSRNWVVSKLAALYVETVRNIPLYVQLAFWYFAVLLFAFPRPNESIVWLGSVYLNKRGVYLPWPFPTDAFAMWGMTLLAAAVVGAAVYAVRRLQLKRADRPGFPFLWAVGTFIALGAVGWFWAPGAPLRLDFPFFDVQVNRFNVVGGIELSAPFIALLTGLIMYTGAFIAEIVRAGIQSVNMGQAEAAKALGLRPGGVLRLVILPQALRVIIPPLASQYLNLIKNSSLAILIGYYDLVNVGTTIFNQTGRVVEVIVLIMGAYLSMSLLTSAFMNYYNKRIRLVER